MTREQKIAWAAGLFEGEGTICIGTHSSNGRKYVRLALSTTDEDVMGRFVDVVQVGRVNGPYQEKKGNKPRFHWQAQTLNATDYVLALFEPFMGKRRYQQWRMAQAAVDAQPPKKSVGRPRVPLR